MKQEKAKLSSSLILLEETLSLLSFAHYLRSQKILSSPSGWDAPLYNGEILQEGLQEVIFVEGETRHHQLDDVWCGECLWCPGSDTKKATWIDALDKIQPKKIYILYDNDKAGKKASQEIASRIGIDKCRKLILPSFTVTV